MSLDLSIFIFFFKLNFRASFFNESVSLIQELLGVVLPVSDARQATNIRNIWHDMCAKDALAKHVPFVLTWTLRTNNASVSLF